MLVFAEVMRRDPNHAVIAKITTPHGSVVADVPCRRFAGFQLACERDLEGIVAKHRQSRYVVEDGNPTWVKIRNRKYSQLSGRDELFERRYEDKGAAEIGWDVCDRAAAAQR